MIIKSKTAVIASMSLLMGASAPLYAQASANTQQMAQPGADNVNWNEREIRNGIIFSRLLGIDVRGKNGNSLGEVQNVIITNDKVTAIVFDYGGFLNIGDAHFRMPWNQVRFGRDMDHVIVPLSEQTAERYQEKRSGGQPMTGPGEMRAREVIGDTAVLRDGTRYGEIQDLLATRNGDVKAVVVNANFETQRGRYAYPYAGGAFDANANAYRLPYDRTQALSARPFNYRLVNIAEPGGVGATGATGAGGEGGGEQRSRPPRQSRG